MSFYSLQFVVFLVALLACYYAVGRFAKRGQWIVLLVGSLAFYLTTGWQNLSSNAAPVLSVYDTPAKLRVDVYAVAETGWLADLKVITADVEWGPEARRRSLSGSGHAVQVWRGDMGRAP